MAYPTYPIGLPCPQSGPLRSVERRDLTEVSGPRDAAPFQRAGQDNQTLTFRLSFAQAAPWSAWWRDTLTMGGAWFLAHWPHPTGETVPRRFMSQPVWSLIKGYGWDVTIDAEVLSLDSMPAATERPLWLDNFTGAPVEINEHPQDIPLRESTWWGGLEDTAWLDGAGNVASGPDLTSTQPETEFASAEDPIELEDGWRLEFDAMPVPYHDGDPFEFETSVFLTDAEGLDVRIQIVPQSDYETVSVWIYFAEIDGFEYTVPFGRKRVVLTQSAEGFTVRINGDVYEPVEYPIALQLTGATLRIPILRESNGGELGDRPLLTPIRGSISRVALYGVIATP